MNIQYRANEKELTALMAAEIARHAANRYAAGKPFRLAVSGGGTARHYFPAIAAQLLQQHPDAATLTELYQVDERFVPLHHTDSNWLAVDELLVKVLPGCKAYPMVTDDANIVASTDAYEQLLQSSKTDELYLFDYAILGMGPDAHFASLFPGSPLLKEEQRLTGHYAADTVKHSRITITLPALRHTRGIGMYITGEDKASVFAQAMEQGEDMNKPVSFLGSMEQMTVYTDAQLGK